MPRLDDGAVDPRRVQRAVLARQVVADHDHVHRVAHLVQEEPEPAEPELQRAVDNRLKDRRLLDHVDVEVLQPAHVPADLVDDARYAADDGVRRLLPDPHRAVAEALEAGGVVALGERVVPDLLDRHARQRRMGDVHVVRIVVRHGPGYAELVGEVVPQPPVPPVLDDAALEALGPAGPDVARVHAQALKHGLGGHG